MLRSYHQPRGVKEHVKKTTYVKKWMVTAIRIVETALAAVRLFHEPISAMTISERGKTYRFDPNMRFWTSRSSLFGPPGPQISAGHPNTVENPTK